MSEFIKKNIGIVLAILLVVFGLVIYLNFFAGNSSDPLLSSESNNSEVSQEILIVLTSLNSIKLDNSIFNNAVFLSLTSYGVELAPENVGRRNPFEPLNGN